MGCNFGESVCSLVSFDILLIFYRDENTILLAHVVLNIKINLQLLYPRGPV